MFLNTLFGYVIPYGILLVCNIRVCFEVRKIIRTDRKHFKKIRIGKNLCKLKKENSKKLGIEMEAIDPKNVKMEDIEVSSPIMTDKAIETSLILEADERITEMYVSIRGR